MKKVKNTIPVYDIDTLNGVNHLRKDIIAETLADYLEIHPNLHTPHRHDFYHLLLFTRGSGTHTIDFERFTVVPGQIYFMVPGQVHSWNFTGKPDGYIINFQDTLLQNFLYNRDYLGQFSFFRGVAKDSVLNLTGETYEQAADIFSRINREVKNTGFLNTDMICALLVGLFVTVGRVCQHPLHEAAAQTALPVLNFRRLVEEHYTEKHLPKEYAAMLYITPNHLNALCNDLLGKPAGEIIRDRILLEAKRLLVNADLNVSDISDRLNFADNSYFTKFFKKYTGLTPEQFRKTSFIQVQS